MGKKVHIKKTKPQKTAKPVMARGPGEGCIPVR